MRLNGILDEVGSGKEEWSVGYEGNGITLPYSSTETFKNWGPNCCLDQGRTLERFSINILLD